MATNTIARDASRKSIPVRKITHEDLSIALRQGLDDFLTFRGDIVFAGIVYTVIGIAAVVMTTSMSLVGYSADIPGDPVRSSPPHRWRPRPLPRGEALRKRRG